MNLAPRTPITRPCWKPTLKRRCSRRRGVKGVRSTPESKTEVDSSAACARGVVTAMYDVSVCNQTRGNNPLATFFES